MTPSSGACRDGEGFDREFSPTPSISQSNPQPMPTSNSIHMHSSMTMVSGMGIRRLSDPGPLVPFDLYDSSGVVYSSHSLTRATQTPSIPRIRPESPQHILTTVPTSVAGAVNLPASISNLSSLMTTPSNSVPLRSIYSPQPPPVGLEQDEVIHPILEESNVSEQFQSNPTLLEGGPIHPPPIPNIESPTQHHQHQQQSHISNPQSDSVMFHYPHCGISTGDCRSGEIDIEYQRVYVNVPSNQQPSLRSNPSSMPSSISHHTQAIESASQQGRGIPTSFDFNYSRPLIPLASIPLDFSKGSYQAVANASER